MQTKALAIALLTFIAASDAAPLIDRRSLSIQSRSLDKTLVPRCGSSGIGSCDNVKQRRSPQDDPPVATEDASAAGNPGSDNKTPESSDPGSAPALGTPDSDLSAPQQSGNETSEEPNPSPPQQAQLPIEATQITSGNETATDNTTSSDSPAGSGEGSEQPALPGNPDPQPQLNNTTTTPSNTTGTADNSTSPVQGSHEPSTSPGAQSPPPLGTPLNTTDASNGVISNNSNITSSNSTTLTPVVAPDPSQNTPASTCNTPSTSPGNGSHTEQHWKNHSGQAPLDFGWLFGSLMRTFGIGSQEPKKT